VPQPDGKLKVSKEQVAGVEDGRYLMVTEEFRQLKGYSVGDRFELRSLKKNKMLAYTIAGVVWSPGIDVMVSTFDLGKQFEQRTAASVFGTLKDSREDFGVETVYLLAANLEVGLEKKTLVDRLTKDLGDKGFKVADVRELKHNIQQGFYRLLLVASTVAWAAMAVASLGVTNTIMAGIRSRQWQFGILRSVGVTRSSLLRLVLAEAVLIGVVGSLLGLGAGFAMAVDARELSRLVIGYAPPTAVPWGIVFIGRPGVELKDVSVPAVCPVPPAVRDASPFSPGVNDWAFSGRDRGHGTKSEE
jgi:putative ABC transport system permease protein